MPMWAAVAVVAAAYLVRSFLRGWDFSPDMPIDAVFGATLAALLLLRWSLARSSAADEADDPRHAEVQREHAAGDHPGDDDELGRHVDA